MNDMRGAIVPKSDQINADDLIAGPITVKIREVKIKSGTEQPVSIFFDGDNGKPWKVCKSMSRVLVAAWGPDANAYVGRSATLYRDPKVKWAGMEVGGIRISHLSHIERDMMMALTETKGSRKPFTVRPLKAAVVSVQSGRAPVAELADAAAKDGTETFRGFWKDLSKEERAALQPDLANYQAVAKAADEAKAAGGSQQSAAGEVDAPASDAASGPDAVTIPTINVATNAEGQQDLKRWHADALAAIETLASPAEVELFEKTYAIMIKKVVDAKKAWGAEIADALQAKAAGFSA